MTPGINHFPVASITWFASARTFPGTSPSNTAAILSPSTNTEPIKERPSLMILGFWINILFIFLILL